MVAGEHIYDAGSTETGDHGDDSLWLGPDFADDSCVFAVWVFTHFINQHIGCVRGNYRKKFSFVGDVKRIQAM